MAFDFHYEASPTGALFHRDRTRVRAVMGPVGSGKTSMCVVELILWAAGQKADRNGMRRTRFAVIRATYPELESTTIETFKSWLGNMVQIKYGSPIKGLVVMPLPDGTTVHMELRFLALDREEDISRKLKSFEMTGAFINEASEVKETVFTNIKERIGRYPETKSGVGATRIGIIMDTNPPPTQHWFHRVFEVDRPRGHILFIQPPAVLMDHRSPVKDRNGNGWTPNPNAENIRHLEEGHGYYMEAIPGQTESHVRNRYAGEYGTVHTSGAVYSNYEPAVHKSVTPLPIRPGEPVYLGFDWGLFPGMAACQLSPRGRLEVLDELAPKNVDFATFVSRDVLPLLRRRYHSCQVIAVGDPSGSNRSDLTKRDRFKILQRHGVGIAPANTNDATMRKEGLDYWLNMMGGFLLDSTTCPILAEALAGAYEYGTPQAGSLTERIKKGYHSHVMDALQYVAMELKIGFLRGGSRLLGLPQGSKHPLQRRSMQVNGLGLQQNVQPQQRFRHI